MGNPTQHPNRKKLPAKSQPVVHASELIAPASPEPILLSNELRRLEIEVARVQSLIQKCEHTWTVGEVRTVTLQTARNEASGGVDYFAMVQQRSCSVCGLKQEKIRHDPRMEWTNWSNRCQVHFA